mgnify:CR=1 FL=1
MKKKKFAAFLTALAVGLSGAVTADAMLSEDEQKAAYIEKAVREALEAETETDTEGNVESDNETVADTEAVTESQMEETTEEVSEAETEAETETQFETEAVSEEEQTDNAESQTEKIMVAIDASHQGADADLTEEEPVGPGSETMIKGFSEGISGTATGLEENELNLEVATKLKDILEERGYEVFMTREDADTQLSEVERAELVNASDAQILISLHANGGDDSSERGACAQAPSYENPYITDTDLVKKSNALGDIVLQAYCDKTGLTDKGLYNIDSRAQINWSKIPVIVLEMGFMSNTEDDTYMAEDTNQQKMAEGIADGIDLYFGRS